MLKTAVITVAALAGVHAAVTTNYASNTDPTQITIPDIVQTTSNDPTQECTYYTSPYSINPTEWPNIWDTANKGINTSSEFTALYNSIDWTGVPKVQPRKLTAAGGLDMSGYDVVNDPDCWWSASQCVTPKTAGIKGDIYTCEEPETLGLTFDDGPNCSHNAFYDYLEQQKQKASMFYIGSNVLAWPYGALRGVKDGHHIASHTWSHQLMTTLTNEEVLAELYYSTKAIKYVTGLTPLYWRPAQGDIDDRVRWIATQLGLTAMLWNIDTDDWAAGVVAGVTLDTVNQRYQDFINMGTNGTFSQRGALMLSHEINNQTMSLAIQHYPQLKAAYKHVIDVATCANITNPYMESSVTFPTFEQAVGSTISSTSGNGASSSSVPKTGAGSAAPRSIAINGPLFIAALFAVLAFA